MSLQLVVVYKDWNGDVIYAAYQGRKLTHRYAYRAALPPEWVEEIRRDPGQFEAGQEAPEAA